MKNPPFLFLLLFLPMCMRPKPENLVTWPADLTHHVRTRRYTRLSAVMKSQCVINEMWYACRFSLYIHIRRCFCSFQLQMRHGAALHGYKYEQKNRSIYVENTKTHLFVSINNLRLNLFPASQTTGIDWKIFCVYVRSSDWLSRLIWQHINHLCQ